MKAIVVSPHPDDETLGAGGTILKYKNSGSKIYWLNVTNMTEDFGFRKEEVVKRKREIEKVSAEYEFDGFFDLSLKPTELDAYPMNSVIGKISDVFREVEPNVVILPYQSDIHSDHRIVFESSYACTKTFRYPYIKKIMAMEVVSETDFSTYNNGFVPNYYVDISDFLDKKIKIAKTYQGELRNCPFPRSAENIEALATIRGSQAGCRYAESFLVLKDIW